MREEKCKEQALCPKDLIKDVLLDAEVPHKQSTATGQRHPQNNSKTSLRSANIDSLTPQAEVNVYCFRTEVLIDGRCCYIQRHQPSTGACSVFIGSATHSCSAMLGV